MKNDTLTKIFGMVMSLGLVLMPVNNWYLGRECGINYYYIGVSLILFGGIFLLSLNTEIFKKINWWIFAPVLVIALFITLRVLLGYDKPFNIVLAISFIIMYLVCRNYGKMVTLLLPFVVIIQAVSVIIQSFIAPPESYYFLSGIITTPGMSEFRPDAVANYNLAIAYMAYGFILSDKKWQPYVLMFVLPAVVFVGSIEGIYIMGFILVVMLIRRDWDKRLWIAMGLGAIAIIYFFVWGNGIELWDRTLNVVNATVAGDISRGELNWRLQSYIKCFNEFNFLGNGYEQIVKPLVTVHNVPLVIVNQIGFVPAMAWLFCLVYSFRHSRRIYLWSAIIVMCLFDHWVWTTMAMYFWVALGLSDTKINDRVYKNVAS